MTTVRHLEKLWNARVWGKLLRELLQNRPEASLRLQTELHSLVATAALAMIRLDELSQTHTPLFSKLLRTVIASQERDGGWRDAGTTALCVRALLIDRGRGLAIDGGLHYLATLQKEDGSWPREPLRRMPADGFTSAWAMFQLGNRAEFRAAVRFEDALRWFAPHTHEMDGEASRLWNLAAPACRLRAADEHLLPLFSRQCA